MDLFFLQFPYPFFIININNLFKNLVLIENVCYIRARHKIEMLPPKKLLLGGAVSSNKQALGVPKQFVPSKYLISKINIVGSCLKETLVAEAELEKALREAACALALEKTIKCSYVDKINLKKQFLSEHFNFKDAARDPTDHARYGDEDEDETEKSMGMTEFISNLSVSHNIFDAKFKIEKYINALVTMHTAIIAHPEIIYFLKQHINDNNTTNRVEELVDEANDCEVIQKIIRICKMDCIDTNKKLNRKSAKGIIYYI